MLDMIQKAQAQFMEIESILHSNTLKDQNYFAVLSAMADEAYLTMNSGMCDNVSVCQECAEHRDYLLSALSMLDDLSAGKEFTPAYQEQLNTFSQKISEIHSKISAALKNI